MGTSDNQYKPTVYSTPQDGKTYGPGGEGKICPNGITVTAAAIWQRWAFYDKGVEYSKTSAIKFEKLYDVQKIAKGLQKKYPGSSSSTEFSKAAENIQKIGNASHGALTYTLLRSVAEVVDMPLGLFLLFTNLISQERRLEKKIAANQLNRKKKKEELLKLVSKIELFAREARRSIELSSDTDEIFYETFSKGNYIKARKHAANEDEDVYLARLELLKAMRDASKIG